MIERAAAAVFAARGYHGTTMAQIARASGVTVPVIYDHFPSKVALHRRLLERTSDELLAMWRSALAADVPADGRIPHAIDAWATYVQANPYAPADVLHRDHRRPGDPRAPPRDPGARAGGARARSSPATPTRRAPLRGATRWPSRWPRRCCAPD